MNIIKNQYLLIGILALEFFSCKTNHTKETNPTTDNIKQQLSEQTIEQIRSLPDTVLTSKNITKNEFQADLSKIKINNKKTTLLNGEWITENGKLSFFNTTLELGDKVIFHNTSRSSMTGWGVIRYNRAVQFYLTESGNHMYEYYVLDDNSLILTQYDYRNNDLSMKKQPESRSLTMTANFINKNEISLELGGQIAKLKRTNYQSIE